MEKYFIVTEESGLHKEWFDYKENLEIVRSLVKGFMVENGIEAHEYYVNDAELHIVPTEKDAETFKSVLCAPINEGLMKFKKSSSIGKAWVKSLKDAGLKVHRKPMVILYFKSFSGGRFRSRLFDQNGFLYCSLDPVQCDTPKGFKEIKASEFFRIVEESEEIPA